MKLFYVYRIRSISNPKEIYTGYSENFYERILSHNEGKNKYTATFKPWKLITLLCFTEELKAKKFEAYLKSGSGRAFAKLHF